MISWLGEDRLFGVLWMRVLKGLQPPFSGGLWHQTEPMHWPFLLSHFVCGVLMVYMCVCIFFARVWVHMHVYAHALSGRETDVGSQPQSFPHLIH